MTIYCCIDRPIYVDRPCPGVPKCPPNKCRLNRTNIFTWFVRNLRSLFRIEEDEEPRIYDDESDALRFHEAIDMSKLHKDTNHQENEENSDIKVVNTTRSRGGSTVSANLQGEVGRSDTEDNSDVDTTSFHDGFQSIDNSKIHTDTNHQENKENPDIEVVYTRSRSEVSASSQGSYDSSDSEIRDTASSNRGNKVERDKPEIRAEVNHAFQHDNYDSENVWYGKMKSFFF